jgi:2-polyprenyl-3-methyl-5-hydroxy-6-metoxy-1,4-benzoquinol methylase
MIAIIVSLMRLSNQQKQTRKFFEKDALNWARKAKSEYKYSINVIKQRNEYVEYISSRFLNKNARILDVGCGTGNLVISLLKKKYDAYGVDFASSMIEKAKSECNKYGLSPDRFFLSSFFEFIPDIRYNLISANGFIEYISEKELDIFIKKSHQLLEDNGLVVIGSRNRLFNVFSFNDYTEAEIRGGNIVQLVKECTIFNSIKSFKELLKKGSIPTVSKNLKNHAYTGIEVKSRYQYTPCQIIQKLLRNGFKAIDLIPIHIHILTTIAKAIVPEIHDYTSNYLQRRKDLYMNVIPQSSSFMITARKK